MSSNDLSRLRKGWEALEELAHYGRNGGLKGVAGRSFSSEFLEKTADEVADILEGVSPGSGVDGE